MRLSLGLAWTGGALAAGAGLLALYVLVVWLRLPNPSDLPATGDPGRTAFMAGDGCREHDRQWRPLAEIDPRLICTIIWSEDWLFFHHDGVDRKALRGALEHNWRKKRTEIGGSTITMQLARNLFLRRDRTFTRKGSEIALALELERTFDKQRLLELYLNAAEWAPCVYGAEAASRHYFGHGADRVDLAEATMLAVMLPRPTRPLPAGSHDRVPLVRKQQQLLTRVSRSGLVPKREFLAEQRAILDGWARGWQGREPRPRRGGWPGWRDSACGTVAFRAWLDR